MASVFVLLASACNNVRELFGVLANCGFTFRLNGNRGMLNGIMKDDPDTVHPAMNVIGKFRNTLKFLNLILFKIIYLKITLFFIVRDTASETVRTLLVYGYNLDPPTGEQHEGLF